jgi:hypothetical protein
MTLTTHATIGAVIGTATGNPLLAFVLSFASHFLVDIIPHGDTGMIDNFFVLKKNKRQAIAYSVVDGVIAIFFVLLLANLKDINSVGLYTWGIVGAVLPDLLVGLNEIVHHSWLRQFTKVHFYFHNLLVRRRGDVSLRFAILAQMVIILLLQTKI